MAYIAVIWNWEQDELEGEYCKFYSFGSTPEKALKSFLSDNFENYCSSNLIPVGKRVTVDIFNSLVEDDPVYSEVGYPDLYDIIGERYSKETVVTHFNSADLDVATRYTDNSFPKEK